MSERDDDLFLMVNLFPARTGLPMTVWAGPRGKAPATADVLTGMLALCSDTLIGKRDRALLALGFAGARVPTQ